MKKLSNSLKLAVSIISIILLISIWYILIFTNLLPMPLKNYNYIGLCKIFVTSDLSLVLLGGVAAYGLWKNKAWGLTVSLIVAGCWLYSFICLFAAGIILKALNIAYLIYAVVPIFSLTLIYLFWPRSKNNIKDSTEYINN
ncbi:hypothetical protein HY745_05275 [Candidatus Desantisbacteria bacterium]|nr:hypothetical protein [Candidatus Desantisbacteria bacterium]